MEEVEEVDVHCCLVVVVEEVVHLRYSRKEEEVETDDSTHLSSHYVSVRVQYSYSFQPAKRTLYEASSVMQLEREGLLLPTDVRPAYRVSRSCYLF